MSLDDHIKNLLQIEDKIAFGPSMITAVAHYDLIPSQDIKIAVPDVLIELLGYVENGSDLHKEYLLKIVKMYGGGRFKEKLNIDKGSDRLVNNILNFYDTLRSRDGLIEITDSDIDIITQQSLYKIHNNKKYNITLSKTINFPSEYTIKSYSWIKKAGNKIVEYTRFVPSEMGHYRPVLQIPDKNGDYVGLKTAAYERIFK